MGLVNILRKLLKSEEHKLGEFRPKLAELSPEQEEQLIQLGIDLNDAFSRNRAADVLKTYPDGFETLKRWSKYSLGGNAGYAYDILFKYGTQKVNELVDRYGLKSSTYLDDIVKAIDEFGKDIVDEIADRFELKHLKLIAPNYRKYGPELIQRIIEKYDSSLLSYIFPIHQDIEEAQKTRDTDEVKQFRIQFFGEVQEVDFRSHSRNYANILGILGRVRNERDGSVLCEVQGTEPIVNVFIKGLKQMHGVSKVEKEEVNLGYRMKDYIIESSPSR